MVAAGRYALLLCLYGPDAFRTSPFSRFARKDKFINPVGVFGFVEVEVPRIYNCKRSESYSNCC